MKLLLKSFLAGFALATVVIALYLIDTATPKGCEIGERSPLPLAGTPQHAAVKVVRDHLAKIPVLHVDQAEGRVTSDWTFASDVPVTERGNYWLVWIHYPAKKTVLGCEIRGSQAHYKDLWFPVRKRDLRLMHGDDFPKGRS